ncbi:MAG: hypothetical protein HYZ79_02070, partial [Candidatus Melainabacteria bacterium]|nr:hypothetical protein [Candidatus Melainabacteria bacterium]
IKLFKGSFSRNVEIQSDSAKKLNIFLAPAFGLFSFLTMSFGTVIKSCLGEEGKAFEILSEFGKAAQHFIYFFRMVIPEFNQVKRIAENIKNEEKRNDTSNNLEEIKEFYKEKQNFLFVSGVYAATSLLLPFVKLLNLENETLKKLKGLFEEISGDLVSKFFSHRRYLLGKQFEVENPEFY